MDSQMVAISLERKVLMYKYTLGGEKQSLYGTAFQAFCAMMVDDNTCSDIWPNVYYTCFVAT